MKTSFEVQDSPELSSVVNSHPDSSSSESSMEIKDASEDNLGYDIMDDIQKSQSNYITEYIVIPLCIIGVIALVVFLYLKFIKKPAGEPEAEGDVEKQALQDSTENAENVENDKKEDEVEQKTAEEVTQTTENVGQEEKKEEEAKE